MVVLILLFVMGKCSSDGVGANDAENTEKVSAPQLSDEEIQQRADKAESDRILAEAQAEYEANHEVELKPVDLPDSTLKSKSQPMDFSTCKNLQSQTMISVLPYESFIVLNSDFISTIKVCTNDGAVLMSCSATDNVLITTQTDNTAGCE